VDEYYKEMELLMIRTGTREDIEAMMSRFLNGLNFEVRDRVEMVYYNDLQDLVHQAERAEQQIKHCKLHYLQIHGVIRTPRLLVLVHKRLQHAPTIFLIVPHQILECPKLHLRNPQQISSVLLVEDEDT
jgi:hypothetical protein